MFFLMFSMNLFHCVAAQIKETITILITFLVRLFY